MKPWELATAKPPLAGADVAAGAADDAAELAAAATDEAKEEAEAATDMADEAAGTAELAATVPEAAAAHWALDSATRASEQSVEQ